MTDTEPDNLDAYLELLKLALTGALQEDNDYVLGGRPGTGPWRSRVANWSGNRLRSHGFELVRKPYYDPARRARGLDRPGRAESMIGIARMDNIRSCVESVLREGVPGDLIETGVWRGGATIFMRAILRAHGDTDRIVWVADSFKGLPPPDGTQFPADTGDKHHTFNDLRVGVDQVKHNFHRYGLLDDRVRFLVGWFKDTLPSAPMDQISVMRLDGDMYESTIQALESLYPKLAVGGYCIIDDFGMLPGARRAVLDYRKVNGIDDEIMDIDGTGAFWRRGDGVMEVTAATRSVRQHSQLN